MEKIVFLYENMLVCVPSAFSPPPPSHLHHSGKSMLLPLQLKDDEACLTSAPLCPVYLCCSVMAVNDCQGKAGNHVRVLSPPAPWIRHTASLQLTVDFSHPVVCH